MGADIHLYIEHRISPDHPWVKDHHHNWHYEEYVPRAHPCRMLNSCAGALRDYNLFAILASVRGRGGVPRGLPRDISEEIEEAANDNDWHSHSWATLDEFKNALASAGYELDKIELEEKLPFVINYTQLPVNWPSYVDIVRYCDRILDEMQADALLLDTNLEPETRIVYWFDN